MSVLSGCHWCTSEVAPNELIGQTLIATLESGAFPDSTITMQFISSKDIVWKITGNLGNSTGSADYLISRVNPNTILLTWRSGQAHVSYVITMDFGSERCFLVRVDKGNNLLSEGVFAFE
ncbi:MoaF N-terminal domain-containing protein [Halodesulfovibrio marinisediminis]|nr:MoaF N-terminal domain-containing protein [Halodesulfovibrio marinisediminis]